MATARVELKTVPILERDPETHNVRLTTTLNHMAEELQQLREMNGKYESAIAENATLRQVIATFQSCFERPLLKSPQLTAGPKDK